MQHIVKFKSFKAASDYAQEEFYKKGFNPDRAEKFFQEYASLSKNPYKPGLYRFTSFEDAKEYDLKLRIEHSIKNDNACKTNRGL